MQNVKSVVIMLLTMVLKKHGKVMEEMEKLFSMWIQDRHQRQVLLSLMLHRRKGESLHEDLKKKYSEEPEGTFLMPAIAGFIGLRLESTFTM